MCVTIQGHQTLHDGKAWGGGTQKTAPQGRGVGIQSPIHLGVAKHFHLGSPFHLPAGSVGLRQEG